jgi:3',5'-cyclic AMP phosphodiesterase CpdA
MWMQREPREGENKGMNTRKKYILVIPIVLLFILYGCSYSTKDLKPEYKIKSGKDITFFIATDIHYLSKDLTDSGEAFKKFVSTGAGKQLGYIDEILSAFTNEIKNEKPNILIISGDLTSNGEKKSHIDIAKKLNAIEKDGTSVYVIPGNHDILNPWARGFKNDKQYVTDSISNKDFSRIYSEFGYEEAILRDKNTLSYLATPSEDVWLLMLDTNQYENNAKIGFPETGGRITEDTFHWIEKCSTLAKEKGAKIITVMHHNLLDHSEVIQEGYTVNDNEEAIDVFQSNNLDLVLSGHIHIQDISSYKKNTDPMYDIATGSLAVYPHQYGILKYSFEDTGFHYSTSKVDVEGWSKEIGITEKNINNFSEYSREFFGSLAFDMAYKQLIKEKTYSTDEIKSMSETMKILNLRYFAGVESLNLKDLVNSEGFKLWSNSPENFLKKYIMSILEDKDTDDNNLQIQISTD